MDYKKMFEKCDANHDGKVTLAEFQKSLETLGIACCPEKTKSYFERCDKNRNGWLDITEYSAAMNELLAANPKLASVLKAFATMQKDGSTPLTVKELATALSSSCPELVPEESFAKADADKDGKITVRDFIASMLQQPACRFT